MLLQGRFPVFRDSFDTYSTFRGEPIRRADYRRAAQPSPQPPSDQPPSHASPSLGQHHGCTAAATRLSSQHSHTHRPSQPSHPPSRPISAQR